MLPIISGISLVDPRTEKRSPKNLLSEARSPAILQPQVYPVELSFNLSGMFGAISFRGRKESNERTKCDLPAAKAFSIISGIDVN